MKEKTRRTWLVPVPVGVGRLPSAQPAEGAVTVPALKPDPENVPGATEHQAVGEGLLKPSQIKHKHFKWLPGGLTTRLCGPLSTC